MPDPIVSTDRFDCTDSHCRSHIVASCVFLLLIPTAIKKTSSSTRASLVSPVKTRSVKTHFTRPPPRTGSTAAFVGGMACHKKNRTSSVHGVFWERLKMTQVALFYALSQVRRQGDLGGEVDGIKGDAVKFLGDDDGCRKRGVPFWSSRKTHLSKLSCGSTSYCELSHGVRSRNSFLTATTAAIVSSLRATQVCAQCLILCSRLQRVLFPVMSTHRTTHGHQVCLLC